MVSFETFSRRVWSYGMTAQNIALLLFIVFEIVLYNISLCLYDTNLALYNLSLSPTVQASLSTTQIWLITD